ncbi:MAG: hypothetical protein JHC31_13575 [Sulfurihydrogenibium sp.]|nr:hypothetical protein [Sulfurihydrogenibium sp.]
MAKKIVEIDKGVYKLLVEVEYEEFSTEIPEIGEGVAQAIADAIEKARNKEDKKKKKGRD